MNLGNFTIKAAEAVQAAQQLAFNSQNPTIETEHILKALLNQEDSPIEYLLKKNNVTVNLLDTKLDELLDKLPKTTAEPAQTMGREVNSVILRAGSVLKQFKDEFITAEHLLLALLQGKDGIAKLLKDAGLTEKGLLAAIKELRKGETVSSQRYALGSQYMTAAWLDGGPSGVRSVYDDANRPKSSVQLMDGRGSAIDVAHAPLGCAAIEAADAFRRVRVAELGAWDLYAFATRAFGREVDAWRIASSWQADAFAVFSNDANQIVLTWRVAFSTRNAAEQFMAALGDLPTTVHVEGARTGAIVTLFATDITEPLDWPDWKTCDPL
jgi:hypothetical protein